MKNLLLTALVSMSLIPVAAMADNTAQVFSSEDMANTPTEAKVWQLMISPINAGPAVFPHLMTRDTCSNAISGSAPVPDFYDVLCVNIETGEVISD